MPRNPSLDTKHPAASGSSSTDMVRTEVDTVKSGLEFKGLRRAGTALIFGRGVKTLTFTPHSQARLYPCISSKPGRRFI